MADFEGGGGVDAGHAAVDTLAENSDVSISSSEGALSGVLNLLGENSVTETTSSQGAMENTLNLEGDNSVTATNSSEGPIGNILNLDGEHSESAITSSEGEAVIGFVVRTFANNSVVAVNDKNGAWSEVATATFNTVNLVFNKFNVNLVGVT